MQKNKKKKQKINKEKPIAQHLETEPEPELEESFENNLLSNLL